MNSLPSWLAIALAILLIGSVVVDASGRRIVLIAQQTIKSTSPTGTGGITNSSLSDSSDTSAQEAFVRLGSSNSSSRSVFIQLIGDSWVLSSPQQFRSASLDLRTRLPKWRAPFGAGTLQGTPTFFRKTDIVFVNVTLAALVFPQVPLFVGNPDTGLEQVVLAISGGLLTSGVGFQVPLRLLSADPKDNGFGLTLDDSLDSPEWTIFISILTILTSVVDPFSIPDLHLLVLMGNTPCTRGSIRSVTSGCWRTLAPFDPRSGDLSPESNVWISSCIAYGIFLTLLAAYMGLKFGKIQPALEGVSYLRPLTFNWMIFFFAGFSWATWRQLFLSEVTDSSVWRAGRIGGGVTGLLTLPFLLSWPLVWRWNVLGKVRVFLYPWIQHRTAGALDRIFLPQGSWTPTDRFWTHQTVLNSLRDGGTLSMALFPFVDVAITTVILATAPEGPSSCSSTHILVSCWAFLMGTLILFCRFYDCFGTVILATASKLFLCLFAAGNAVSAVSNDSTGYVLSIVGASGMMTVQLLRVVFRIYLIVQERSWRRVSQTIQD
jgi:hypothetical protein